MVTAWNVDLVLLLGRAGPVSFSGLHASFYHLEDTSVLVIIVSYGASACYEEL